MLKGEDSQGDGSSLDELDSDAIEEELAGQDDLGDDELQSMLQDDDDSAGAITDTANTDWYLHSPKAASLPSMFVPCYLAYCNISWHFCDTNFEVNYCSIFAVPAKESDPISGSGKCMLCSIGTVRPVQSWHKEPSS